ncbi:MAG TPA: hypothetical protein VF549_02065 [Solirubrobacteraceae bacterium]|jgi:hypothetical protein
MSEPARIFLRILGLVLFVASVVGVVLFVSVGPAEVAEKMGKSCRHSNNGPSEWCHWRDALGMLQALPWIGLIGGVLLLVFRPDGAEQRGGGLRMAGAAAVVVIIVVNLAGVFVYRHTYSVVHQKEIAEKILRDAPRPDFSQRSVKPVDPGSVPHGLARGSLLRKAAFRSAMAEVRRAAPGGARLSRLRVSADRIEAEVLAGRRTITLRKPWNAKVTVVSKAPATDGDATLVSFARLDTAAPQRIAKVAGRDLDYLVLFDAVGLRWNGFLVGGKGQLTASPDGRLVRA